jgi:hypothetical protein
LSGKLEASSPPSGCFGKCVIKLKGGHMYVTIDKARERYRNRE